MWTTFFLTNGELAARAYALAPVPRRSVSPVADVARVEIVDPRRAATLRTHRRASSEPRDPGQNEWRAPKRPGVELPDARPIMKAQRVFVDPELVAQWEQEERNCKNVGTR